MRKERCKELYDLRAEADRAIFEISKFLEKPEYADHAMENLYNIAILSSANLNHFRFEEPELIMSFASKQTQWPYWLSHEQEGWVRTRMPREIREILYEIGLNSDPAGWPVKPANDFLGRQIKGWRGSIVDFRRNPHFSPNLAEDLELNTADRERLLNLPDLDNTKTSRLAWAKVIVDIIFQWYWLRDKQNLGVDPLDLRHFLEGGGELVDRPEGESLLYDKSPFAYSLLRPCSDTPMRTKKTKALQKASRQSREEAEETAKEIVLDRRVARRGRIESIFDPFSEKEKGEIAQLVDDIRSGADTRKPVMKSPHHPSDKELIGNASQFIAGRLKSYPK